MLRRAVALLFLLAAFAAGFVAADKGVPRNVLVPKQWGDFRGVYYDQLLFEDRDGTIRSIFPNGGVVVFTVTRR